MVEKQAIMGVNINNISMEKVINEILTYIGKEKTYSLYTPNSEIIMCARKDQNLKNILNSADIVVPDGAGVILASKILNKPLTEKVSGVDITKKLFELHKTNKIKYYILGGKPGIAKLARKNIINKYPGLEIVGCSDGYFDKNKESMIIDEINNLNPDILLVGLGAPKQEKWINENKNSLNARLIMGIGGTIDIFAGTAKLAPEFMRKKGLEWLYRLYKEPWRFKRMLVLPQFIILAIYIRITSICNIKNINE